MKGGEAAGEVIIRRMKAAKLSTPLLITRFAELTDLVDHLTRQPVVAVDTESNSLYAYREQVCLIQFSTLREDYLVDPLAIRDLSLLGPMFADPKIEKVFHAAEYDLICLERDFEFRFANLFDTMLAARILGREELGLGALLEQEFGVVLDKRNQRANWGQRPLPADLLAYARLDTHYLIQLRQLLHDELVGKELWLLAHEDFRRMEDVRESAGRGAGIEHRLNGSGAEENEHDFWRIKGAHDLSPQKAAVLQELCEYRQGMAQALNRPLFKVINDRTLLVLAQEVPHNTAQLAQVEGLTPGQIQRHGEALLEAIRRGLHAGPIFPPPNGRPDEAFINRLEALRGWRKKAAELMGVKSDVVLPRDLMLAIAREAPCSLRELNGLMQSVPWRMERFGGQIMEALGEEG